MERTGTVAWLTARLHDPRTPDQLLLDHFRLITGVDAATVPAAELLQLYRRRGRAEAQKAAVRRRPIHAPAANNA